MHDMPELRHVWGMRVMVKVRCRCCGGTGEIALSPVYAETLALLRGRREAHGAALARLAGCKNEAMCNRLAALEAHGLAVSRRQGKARVFRAC